MKPILFITTVLFFLSAQADITNYNEQQVIIKDKKINHNEWNIPADMPDVYYNNVSGTITIVDYVNATYYSGITETRGNNSIVVSGLTTLDTVAYTNNAGESLRLLPNAGNCTFNNISPNGCIMVYRHNYIPYIAPLILQNETIENDQYIIATSLTVGNHVDTNRTSGDFIIPSAKQFEVEYSDKVVLAPGFKVNKGGVFKARRGASTYKNR